MYVFLAVLGLCRCSGFSLVVGCGLPVAGAPLAGEHRRGGRRWSEEPRGQRSPLGCSPCGGREPDTTAPPTPSGSELLRPVSPAFAGGFFALEPPEKPLHLVNCQVFVLFCFVSWKSQIGEQFDNENGMIWNHSWKTCQVCCSS